MKKFILLIPILFLMTGCYNYRELNDLAIISGVSVSFDGENYKIITEVLNPKKEQDASSGNEPDYVIYEGIGRSMQEAFRKIVKEAPKKLYGAQMDVLIIDEKTAKEGIDDIMDFFARDPEVRSEFYILVSKSDEVLKIISPLVNISSKNIMSSLEAVNTYMGTASLVTFHDLINDYLNPHIEIALPSVKMIGNVNVGETKTNIEESVVDATNIIGNMAIFKNNKLVGYLNELESLGYNIIMNNSETFLIRSDYDKGDFIVNEIINSTTKMEAIVDKKKITLTIEGKASISEVNKDINLESDEVVSKLNKELNKELETLVKNTIESTIKKFNSDIFGFRDLFYKTNPKKYKKLIKELGDDFLSSLEIDVKAKIEIIEKGNLNGGIYNEEG